MREEREGRKRERERKKEANRFRVTLSNLTKFYSYKKC